MRLKMNRPLGLATSLALATAGLVVLAAPMAASAHNYDANIECTAAGTIASVDLNSYDTGAIVNVTLDAESLASGEIGDSGAYSYYNDELDPMVNHTLMVSVDSFDGTGGTEENGWNPTQYDFSYEVTAAACVTPPPTGVTSGATVNQPTCYAPGSVTGIDNPNYTWVVSGPPEATIVTFTPVGNVVVTPSVLGPFDVSQLADDDPACEEEEPPVYVPPTASGGGECKAVEPGEPAIGSTAIIDANGGSANEVIQVWIDGTHVVTSDFTLNAGQPINDLGVPLDEDTYGGLASFQLIVQSTGTVIATFNVNTDCGENEPPEPEVTYPVTPVVPDVCGPDYGPSTVDGLPFGGPSIHIGHITYTLNILGILNGAGDGFITATPDEGYAIATLAQQGYTSNGDGTYNWKFTVTNTACPTEPPVPPETPPTTEVTTTLPNTGSNGENSGNLFGSALLFLLAGTVAVLTMRRRHAKA